MDLRVPGDAVGRDAHRRAGLVFSDPAAMSREMLQRRLEAFHAQREVAVFHAHALTLSERRMAGGNQVDLTIADTIPGAVEWKRRPRDFFESQDRAVEMLRAGEVADGNGGVMESLYFEHVGNLHCPSTQ